MKGKLYLIPTTLGDTNPFMVLPHQVKNVIEKLNHFIVEREKTARHFIKKTNPEKKQSDLHFYLIDKHTPVEQTIGYIQLCKQGIDVGVMSEAGVPAVADPGTLVVEAAHLNNIQVVPLVGPSSILLALMASGMNGQNFAFNGYLPIDEKDKKHHIRQLEKWSFEKNQPQIFIETPYRNEKLFQSLIKTLQPETKLCIAIDITLNTEYIKTKKIKQWQKEKPELHKRPAIFIIEKVF